MSNSTCSFSSITDLLTKANEHQVNVTTTVESCPDICQLAWGNGNPDLSGIGANISYILQGILTVLCGPVLCLLYELRNRWGLSERTQKHFSTIHDSFLDISAQFSIPVAIAAVIRFRQKAPFYELAFLRTLTTMQFLSLLSTAITVGLFEKPYRRGHQRITIIVLYGILEFAFYIGLIGSLVTSQASWEAISELSEACKAYGKIFPWIKHIPPPAKIHLPHITVKQFFNPLSRQGWKFGLIITGFVIAGVIALCLAVVIILGISVALIRILKGREGRQLVIPMSLAFAIAMLVELVEMERTRNVMKGITGVDFEDNQWGFGQVIALFLWLPLCSQFAYYLLRLDFTSQKTDDPSSGPTSEERKIMPKDIEAAQEPSSDMKTKLEKSTQDEKDTSE